MSKYRYLTRTYGGNGRTWGGLKKIFSVEVPTTPTVPSVKEYLEQHKEVLTEVRTSKKGNEVLRVHYPCGEVIEYPKHRVGEK